MKRVRGLQYTIRGVPATLDRALRARAKQLGWSLNRTALEALTCGAAKAASTRIYTDLDGVIGSWVPDRKVDRALSEQRRIDKDLWH